MLQKLMEFVSWLMEFVSMDYHSSVKKTGSHADQTHMADSCDKCPVLSLDQERAVQTSSSTIKRIKESREVCLQTVQAELLVCTENAAQH